MPDELTAEARARVEGLARYVDLVYGAAGRQRGGEGRGAEDVTQAVFLVAMRKAKTGELPEEGRMAGWLLKVTGYAVKKARRAEERRRRHEEAAGRERLRSADTVGPGIAIPGLGGEEMAEVRRMLDGALLKLGAVDREVVVRRYLREEAGEVAAAVGMRENTARRRIGRALEKLRKILERRGAVVPAAGLTALLLAEGARAAPAGLMAGAVGGASAAAISIAKGAAVMMKVTTIKMLAAAVGVLVMLAVGVWIIVKISGGTDATVAVVTPGDSAITAPMANSGNATSPISQAAPQISISGELPQAGTYALAPGMKLRAAIELSHYAGNGKGLTAMIVRTVNKERVLLPMDLSKVMDEKDAGGSNVELKDGDLVDVRLTEIPREQVFWVVGEVPRPGGYLPAPGMRLRAALTELVGYKGDGKRLAAFIDPGVNEKPAPPVDLSKALDDKDASGSNVEVKNADVIVVESTEKANEDFRNWRPAPGMDRIADADSVGRAMKVSILGAVGRPGVYDIGNHRITLRQAVFAAGIPMGEARQLAINITNDRIKIAPGGYYYSGLFSNVLDGEGYEYCLQPGDVVKIERVKEVQR